MRKIKTILYGDKYFAPNRRLALDGKTWWCVLVIPKGDGGKMSWSSYTCHGRYGTLEDCYHAIKKYHKEGWY